MGAKQGAKVPVVDWALSGLRRHSEGAGVKLPALEQTGCQLRGATDPIRRPCRLRGLRGGAARPASRKPSACQRVRFCGLVFELRADVGAQCHLGDLPDLGARQRVDDFEAFGPLVLGQAFSL